jgi:hypothetical protein
VWCEIGIVDFPRIVERPAAAASSSGSEPLASSAEVERARTVRLAAWALEHRRRRWTRLLMPAALRRARMLLSHPT